VSSHPCCAVRKVTPEARIVGGDPRSTASKQNAGRRSVGFIFPSAVLVLLPKCPACIAAYVAMGTGIGLSVAAATYLRIAIVSLCLLAMVYFAARHAGQPLRAYRSSNSGIQP
jgi:hypothetical protein